MPSKAHAAYPTAGEPDHGPSDGGAEPSPSTEQRLLTLRELGHTLRTPLSAIIGFAEMMAQEHRGPLPNDAYREYAEIIRQSGLQMLELVNHTLLAAAEDVRRSPT